MQSRCLDRIRMVGKKVLKIGYLPPPLPFHVPEHAIFEQGGCKHSPGKARFRESNCWSSEAGIEIVAIFGGQPGTDLIDVSHREGRAGLMTVPHKNLSATQTVLNPFP